MLWAGDGALGWEKDNREGKRWSPPSVTFLTVCQHHFLLVFLWHLQLGLTETVVSSLASPGLSA